MFSGGQKRRTSVRPCGMDGQPFLSWRLKGPRSVLLWLEWHSKLGDRKRTPIFHISDLCSEFGFIDC